MDMLRSQTRRLSSVWALMAVAQIAFAASIHAEEPAEIYFHDDYNKAIRQAKLTRKPIFLEFRCAP
jgi:hypothetical protein